MQEEVGRRILLYPDGTGDAPRVLRAPPCNAQVPHCEQNEDSLYKPQNGRVDFVRQRELEGSEDTRQELEEAQKSKQLHQSHPTPDYARVLRRH